MIPKRCNGRGLLGAWTALYFQTFPSLSINEADKNVCGGHLGALLKYRST
jgi:hypothetical protein